MKQILIKHTRFEAVILLLFLVGFVLVGCTTQPTTQPTESSASYSGALETTYEGALSPANQLALGTMLLENTEHAVTEEQAAVLLPVWQSLQGNEIQGDAERYAAIRLVEASMSEVQIAAIATMQLTQDDGLAWMEDRAGDGLLAATALGAEGGQRPQDALSGIAGEPMAVGQVTSLQWGGGANTWALSSAVLALLQKRCGLEVEQDQETIPVALEPTTTPTAMPTSEPDTVDPAQAPESEESVGEEPDATVDEEPEPTVTPMPDEATPETAPVEVVSSDPVVVPTATPVSAAPLAALEWIEDTNPGPPFVIEVSANAATQDPLVEASRTYKVTGVVRNDGDQTYAVSALNVTFYDAEGFRGVFVPAIRDGKVVGGEWLWHGETEAEFAALLLAPGEEWPFEIEIVAQDMASFLIHPDAVATDRESVPVALSDVRLVDEGTGYLRISGTATNMGAFAAKNVTVSGALIDGNGQIVSVGSVYVLQEGIEPGASVSFDVRIEKEAYTSYQLYAQAERDWE